jgi:hypothetical protein
VVPGWLGGECTTGLIHSYSFGPADTVIKLAPAWPFVGAYFAMAVIFMVARKVTVPTDGPGH